MNTLRRGLRLALALAGGTLAFLAFLAITGMVTLATHSACSTGKRTVF